MSVNWRFIHVMSMPIVLTQLVALSVHVVKALKEMDSFVQVNNLWMDQPVVLHNILVIVAVAVETLTISFVMQILTSV